MTDDRDDFLKPVIDALCKRAAYICSNPECRVMTIAPSSEDDSKSLYCGKAAHITAAAAGGPRYDPDLSSEERRSIGNGIFLCSNCADIIDKNQGLDFSVGVLKGWNKKHHDWVKENLNMRVEKDGGPAHVINVTSHGQQGGITTGVLNVGLPGRALDVGVKEDILRGFPSKEGDVRVIAVMGDQEAFRYAKEISDFLLREGYSVQGGGVAQGVWDGPVTGLKAFIETREIWIGTNV